MRRAAAVLVLAPLLAGAAEARDRADETFRPDLYFVGRTHSEGAFVDAAGRPESRFSGDTRGRRERDGSTTFDQTIRLDDGTVRRRSFRLVRTGPDTFDVTGSEVVGVARAEIRGRTLHLVSTIRLQPGNPLSDVEFDQTMELQPDGRRLRNRSTISKLGFVARRADETFVQVGRERR